MLYSKLIFVLILLAMFGSFESFLVVILDDLIDVLGPTDDVLDQFDRPVADVAQGCQLVLIDGMV